LDLMQALIRAVGSEARAMSAISAAAEGLGLISAEVERVLVALALCEAGMRPEEVSKHLDWKEFERFCSGVFRAWGFVVRENVLLSKPRAQIDLLAFGANAILSVDCKHWKRAHSPAALGRFANDQLRRSELLRKRLDDRRSIGSLIVSFSEPEGKFVNGVAVVPIRTLASFLGTFESYSNQLELR
jgi:hypothetical protein